MEARTVLFRVPSAECPERPGPGIDTSAGKDREPGLTVEALMEGRDHVST